MKDKAIFLKNKALEMLKDFKIRISLGGLLIAIGWIAKGTDIKPSMELVKELNIPIWIALIGACWVLLECGAYIGKLVFNILEHKEGGELLDAGKKENLKKIEDRRKRDLLARQKKEDELKPKKVAAPKKAPAKRKPATKKPAAKKAAPKQSPKK